MVINSIIFLFRLLDQFGSQKNTYAPIIYKTLTFVLIENHSQEIIREFIMDNFISVFESIESIPLSILIEPLLKEIQVFFNKYYIFNFFYLFSEKNILTFLKFINFTINKN